MSDIEKQIQAKITQFAAELHALVRDAAFDAVSGALGRRGAMAARAGHAAKPPSASASPSPAVTRTKGQKRSPTEIARTVERLAGSIAAKGGQRIEQIAKALGLHTDDLALPTAKLLGANRIRKTGQRRGTKYYAVVKSKK